MAGSQLKKLKESLKAAGLTGQTNVKRKGKKNAPSETRRDDRKAVINAIREEFNPFEVKMNRNKRDINEARKSKVVVGRPGISKQIGEEQRKNAYEANKKLKNKVGGVVDRRFGENNPNLNPEDKMLERFTRERQLQSSKRSLFNLEDDDDDNNNYYDGGDDDNNVLTHYGKSLSLQDDFDQGDLGLPEAISSNRKRSYQVEDEDEGEDEVPVQRKKTKAEVMKEVIAKSKFYKHQRQLQQQQTENEILDLDDNFEDVMSSLQEAAVQNKKQFFDKKSEQDIAYDTKLRELALDRRAVPSDRSKTDEELEKERAEKLKKLEQDRLRRMEGLDIEEQKDKDAVGADDLDDDFWGNASENEEDGFTIKESEDEDEDEVETETGKENSISEPTPNVIKIGNKIIKSTTSLNVVKCPETHKEFLDLLSKYEFCETPEVVSKILNTYQPRLAAGNKEKLAVFSSILLNHILHLSNGDHENKQEFIDVEEKLIHQLKMMAEKYNESLCETFRMKIVEIQERINENQNYPEVSDLIFYSIVGMLYSTSDLYHLVVTPTLILMGQSLESLKPNKNLKNLISGLFISDLMLKYQRISKRYVPEIAYFLEEAFLTLVPEVNKLNAEKLSTVFSTKHYAKNGLNLNKNDKITGTYNLKISDINLDHENLKNLEIKSALLVKALDILGNFISIWKEQSAFIEITTPFIAVLRHLVKYQAQYTTIPELLEKLVKLHANNLHKPLQLQDHKPVAIATFAPKFEENFNPDKKSYDPDLTRQEIGKLKASVKKERKLALKEIRKDNKFEARQQIKEKKQEYKDYHARMARIVNSISTIEGAEKNDYEREKKLRKNKR
ncbi:hypothetical protein PACTADRAFT_47508 [Pachysolen tannophilus NRRL Y-2460]|uniref:Nucleolar complex protein 14 n=1 Tax=Pachysolen tannophilus NRRL Y-2460 TaxID=669874 RepID=A0A1E4U0W3_PACTA|nr:hypothetical protein PACTADRAFT_47508 [Pachysolen tannophilus NRRL Y-2460]